VRILRRYTARMEEEPAPRRRSIAFAAVLWVILTGMLLGVAVLEITYGFRGSRVMSLLSLVLGLVFLLMLWAALTGWIVRQRWPQSRLARVTPEAFKMYYVDARLPRPVLTMVCAAIVIAALVALLLWGLLR